VSVVAGLPLLAADGEPGGRVSGKPATPCPSEWSMLFHEDKLNLIARQAAVSIVKCRLLSDPLTSGDIKLGKILPILPGCLVLGLERPQKGPPRLRSGIHAHLAVLMRKAG
jgi:hypothetical protein